MVRIDEKVRDKIKQFIQLSVVRTPMWLLSLANKIEFLTVTSNTYDGGRAKNAYAGRFYSQIRTIHLYDVNNSTFEEIAHTLAHELAHSIWDHYLTKSEKDEFRKLTQLEGVVNEYPMVYDDVIIKASENFAEYVGYIYQFRITYQGEKGNEFIRYQQMLHPKSFDFVKHVLHKQEGYSHVMQTQY